MHVALKIYRWLFFRAKFCLSRAIQFPFTCAAGRRQSLSTNFHQILRNLCSGASHGTAQNRPGLIHLPNAGVRSDATKLFQVQIRKPGLNTSRPITHNTHTYVHQEGTKVFLQKLTICRKQLLFRTLPIIALFLIKMLCHLFLLQHILFRKYE